MHSFGNASKAAITMITAAGFQPMMVDDMVGLASLIAMMLTGVVCVGASFLLASMDVHGGLDASQEGFNGAVQSPALTTPPPHSAPLAIYNYLHPQRKHSLGHSTSIHRCPPHSYTSYTSKARAERRAVSDGRWLPKRT